MAPSPAVAAVGLGLCSPRGQGRVSRALLWASDPHLMGQTLSEDLQLLKSQLCPEGRAGAERAHKAWLAAWLRSAQSRALDSK